MTSPIGLSAPWNCFYREIEALFKDDPEIRVVYDEKNLEIILYVDNAEKAKALNTLLPVTRTFGNVTIFLTVVPPNTHAETTESLFETAFAGNPAFAYVASSPKIAAKYIVFKNKVVQYFNDSFTDAHGLCSTLYQDIAKDIFGEEAGVFFCTDVSNDASEAIPLKNWP